MRQLRISILSFGCWLLCSSHNIEFSLHRQEEVVKWVYFLTAFLSPSALYYWRTFSSDDWLYGFFLFLIKIFADCCYWKITKSTNRTGLLSTRFKSALYSLLTEQPIRRKTTQCWIELRFRKNLDVYYISINVQHDTEIHNRKVEWFKYRYWLLNIKWMVLIIENGLQSSTQILKSVWRYKLCGCVEKRKL